MTLIRCLWLFLFLVLVPSGVDPKFRFFSVMSRFKSKYLISIYVFWRMNIFSWRTIKILSARVPKSGFLCILLPLNANFVVWLVFMKDNIHVVIKLSSDWWITHISLLVWWIPIYCRLGDWWITHSTSMFW